MVQIILVPLQRLCIFGYVYTPVYAYIVVVLPADKNAGRWAQQR